MQHLKELVWGVRTWLDISDLARKKDIEKVSELLVNCKTAFRNYLVLFSLELHGNLIVFWMGLFEISLGLN